MDVQEASPPDSHPKSQNNLLKHVRMSNKSSPRVCQGRLNRGSETTQRVRARGVWEWRVFDMTGRMALKGSGIAYMTDMSNK